MKSQNTIARIFGIFFLLAFISYGVGTGLTTSITEAADGLSAAQSHKTQFVIGVILMALVHSIVNIGLPVLMMPLLKPHNKVLSYGYLSAGITATVVLIVGSVFLMAYLPLSSLYAQAEVGDVQYFETLGTILSKGNFYAYQIGMAIWGIGGLMFCYLLNKSQLVPKVFAIWGFLGYLVFISGTIAELFGVPIGVALALPGGLFEIVLSFWLMFKGFRKSSTATATPAQMQFVS